MNIRKLKKRIKGNFNNHNKEFLSNQLIQLGSKHGVVIEKLMLKISKSLNLLIDEPTSIEPNTFIVDMDFRTLLFVKQVTIKGSSIFIYYHRSYDIESRNCTIYNSKTKTYTLKYHTEKYGFSDNTPHGGCYCTNMSNYRKALMKEILRTPSEVIKLSF